MFEKPAEMIIHRPQYYGGLGLHSPKYKALAGFISTFLQTAANPVFKPNLLHSQLYRKYVLEEDHVPGATNQPPPYLNRDFFDVIKRVKRESSKNIITMTGGLDQAAHQLVHHHGAEQCFQHDSLQTLQGRDSQPNHRLGTLLVLKQAVRYSSRHDCFLVEDAAPTTEYPGETSQVRIFSLFLMQALQASDWFPQT